MKVNLPTILQLQFHMPNNLPELQELSPLSRKNIFSKTKKSVSPQAIDFNPHLEKLNTNYYVKENNIVPYSYTFAQNYTSQQIQQGSAKKFLSVNKTRSSGSKILSLKEFSCIETVSEKSGKENQSDSNSELEVSRSYIKQKEINSQISSPIDFKNFQSTFTVGNMKKSEVKFLANHQISKIAKKYTQTDSSPIRTNRIKLVNYDEQNEKKTNKICLNRKNKTAQNCAHSKRVFQVRISPIKNGHQRSSQEVNVYESSIIFDYNKFHRKNSKSPQPKRQTKSIFHPINEKIFKFFGQEKQRQDFLKISNLNDSFIDIVRQINSPANKISHRNPFINQSPGLKVKKMQIYGKNQVFSSELTCLINEGPRSYSVCNQLRKLSGHKNNFSQSKKDSIVLKTETRPTTGRSQYFNQFQLQTPNKQSTPYPQNLNHFDFTNSNRKIFTKTATNLSPNKISSSPQERRFIKNLFGQNCVSPKKQEKSFEIRSQQKIPTKNVSIERIHTNNSKDSKRRSSKGISVCSKEKRDQNAQINKTQRPTQKIVIGTKLKSLQQIKNMKRLTLASPKNIETHHIGSPIRYKKH